MPASVTSACVSSSRGTKQLSQRPKSRASAVDCTQARDEYHVSIASLFRHKRELPCCQQPLLCTQLARERSLTRTRPRRCKKNVCYLFPVAWLAISHYASSSDRAVNMVLVDGISPLKAAQRCKLPFTNGARWAPCRTHLASAPRTFAYFARALISHARSSRARAHLARQHEDAHLFQIGPEPSGRRRFSSRQRHPRRAWCRAVSFRLSLWCYLHMLCRLIGSAI